MIADILSAVLSLGILAAPQDTGRPIGVDVQLVENRYLEIKVIGRSSARVLVTGRTYLGPYLEVEVRDPEIGRAGWLGPRASVTTPDPCEFFSLAVNEFYGVRVDLLRSDVLRFPDGSEAAFERGRLYEVTVHFRDFDSRESLSPQVRRKVLERVGPAVELKEEVVIGPLRIRIK